MDTQLPPNRLATETSPYLLQHAHNPVEWYPWGEEALALARNSDKPILLSIGYSACHWCHVMAHESFEDAATARLMNELFVNIKVDREERPDLDKIYQAAHHLLTGRAGGWPLTMFLMPDDHAPFFGGTYFPSERRYNMPAFTEVLRGVAQFYRERKPELREQNVSLVRALAQRQASNDEHPLSDEPLTRSREFLARGYDARYGGFGRAPKFPHPTHLERLLRHWAQSRAHGVEDRAALDIALHTLRAMARGGIYDHIGGGFCRYSVDERWMIPHFEKMLYDNGPLLSAYVDACRITREPEFARVVTETGAWVMREMQAPQGGYYATLDADSEGEEGKFYAWTHDALRDVLGSDVEWELFARRYGLSEPANFEGHWHLYAHEEIESLARAFNIETHEAESTLGAARQKVFAAREQRIRPGRDEKILTSWNGLMIKGMAAAGRALQRDDFIQSAERALAFIRTSLRADGRLVATYKDGRARLNAYLDDYAFVIDGILELLQARWNSDEFAFALDLANVMLEQYEDVRDGGFFFTAHDHERLVHRPKSFTDDALPSGNGIAAHVLIRLGHLLGEPRYIKAAERAVRAAWTELTEYPHACNAMLLALDELLQPGQTIILRGDVNSMRSWTAACSKNYLPKRICLAIPAHTGSLPAALNAYAPTSHDVTAYVCAGTQCLPPMHRLEELQALDP